MTGNIIGYRILNARSLDRLEDEVNECIEDGYQPINTRGFRLLDSGLYYIEFIKYEDVNTPPSHVSILNHDRQRVNQIHQALDEDGGIDDYNNRLGIRT